MLTSLVVDMVAVVNAWYVDVGQSMPVRYRCRKVGASEQSASGGKIFLPWQERRRDHLQGIR